MTSSAGGRALQPRLPRPAPRPGAASQPLGASSDTRLFADVRNRSQQLIDATPVSRVRTGVRTVLELTAHPDGHANIAVGSLDTTERGAMRYNREDSLPLNHRRRAPGFIQAILDRLFDHAATEGRAAASRRGAGLGTGHDAH